jgi:hypothetical protein
MDNRQAHYGASSLSTIKELLLESILVTLRVIEICFSSQKEINKCNSGIKIPCLVMNMALMYYGTCQVDAVVPGKVPVKNMGGHGRVSRNF